MHFAVSLAYTTALLTSSGIEYILFQVPSSCNVHFSRNLLLAEFMKSDATHIFQVDDDMGFPAIALLKMLSFKRDFIAAVGNLKDDSGQGYACKVFTRYNQTPVVDSEGLIKATHVGGAFTLITRKAIQKIFDNNLNRRCSRVDASLGYHLYEDKYDGQGFQSEDYNFCERWTETGGEIWIYPDVSFIHTGTKDYIGNYHQFLQTTPKPIKSLEGILIDGLPVTPASDLIQKSINNLEMNGVGQ